MTTTSTAPFKVPEVFFFTGSPDGGPVPTASAEIGMKLQRYLEDTFKSLGIGDQDSTTTAKATCADDAYNKAVPSAAAFISGLMPSFCSDWMAKPTDTFSKNYTAKDVKAVSRRISVQQKRTPPPGPLRADSYPGWSVHFNWKPTDAAGNCVKGDYCDQNLKSLLSQCEG